MNAPTLVNTHAPIAASVIHAPSADRCRAVVAVSGIPFPPLINAGDLICVDFTVTRLVGDSLYVIELHDVFGPWVGIRRFQRMSDGWHMSEDRSGTVQLMSRAQLASMRVIGHVVDVYQSQRNGGVYG